MLSPAYPIGTERLLLRPFEPGDLDALVAIHGDPDVVRYLYDEVRTREDLRPVLGEKATRTELAKEGDSLNLAAVAAETGEPSATSSLFWRSEEHRMGEVGYILDPAHAGRGYATEASRGAAPARLRGARPAPHHRPPRRAQRRLGAGARAARHAPRGAPRRERALQGRVGRRAGLRDARPRVGGRSGRDAREPRRHRRRQRLEAQRVDVVALLAQHARLAVDDSPGASGRSKRSTSSVASGRAHVTHIPPGPTSTRAPRSGAVAAV